MATVAQKSHVSPTQLGMYSRCGEQYRRRYLEKEIIPPGIALLQGSAIHKGAETNFRQKVESHEDLPATEIVEATVAAFQAGTAGGYVLTTDEVLRGHKAVLGEATDQVAGLAEVHATQQAPDYQPVEVEKTTRIVLPQASRDILCITDLRDDQDRITDIKTAGRRKAQGEADTSVQLTTYAAAYHVDHGRPPSELRLDVLVKNKKPTRQVLATTRDQRDFETLARRVNTLIAAIEAGIFPPAPEDAWCCSPKWCGFHSTCPYVNSERLAAAQTKEK